MDIKIPMHVCLLEQKGFDILSQIGGAVLPYLELDDEFLVDEANDVSNHTNMRRKWLSFKQN